MLEQTAAETAARQAALLQQQNEADQQILRRRLQTLLGLPTLPATGDSVLSARPLPVVDSMMLTTNPNCFITAADRDCSARNGRRTRPAQTRFFR